MPMLLLTLLSTKLIWYRSFQLRLQSSINPKYLIVYSCFNNWSLIVISILFGVLRCLRWNIAKFDFFISKDNLFTQNHSYTFVNSLFKVFWRDKRLLLLKNKFESSAKIWKSKVVAQFAKSLKYKRKSSRTRTEPWGTPYELFWFSRRNWKWRRWRGEIYQ